MKAESITKNVSAPRSVSEYLNVLCDLEKAASNFKNRKMFSVIVRYFDSFFCIKNKLLDFVE
ncbi:hypothetical protein PR048_013230 [Dryococelus australis]|uniref:Uncharacterized protein n=1 Tax=Dryococelus australis TaxID=614101 RepID=A0ABQ9HSF6_9NEOP|nr:hypothetical protein PR048_013230 [Dryococelus australis]